MTTNTQTGTVVRKYTAEKFGKLTLEIAGNGRYPDKVDFKTFAPDVIKAISEIGKGETVTVSYILQSEKLVVDKKPVQETGQDGVTMYDVKIPMLKITSVNTPDVAGSNDNVPF